MIAVSLRPANAGFQSTLPTRGSDYRGKAASILNDPISIHAPHEGERLLKNMQQHNYKPFQSTLPTRGSDQYARTSSAVGLTFQSTLPTRGSDLFALRRLLAADVNFNPRSPRGGATLFLAQLVRQCLTFQSTLPTRGSDGGVSGAVYRCTVNFNPRSPRGGATPLPLNPCSTLPHFNPRSPRGGATSSHRQLP